MKFGIKEDVVSICTTRTILQLGCMNCVALTECIRFKSRHNGVSPYEYSKTISQESEVKENEED